MTLLKGRKVHLSQPEPDDLKLLFRWFNDPEVAGDFDSFEVTNWATIEKEFRNAEEQKTFTTFLIKKNDDGANVGLVVHYLSHPTLRNLEIGFQIAVKKERNKGYTTEAVKLLVDYLFSTKYTPRVQATTSVWNKPAQRVLEKCGFRKEGELRDAIFAAGKLQNAYIYSITRSEWKK